MDGLDFDNILGEQDIENLFADPDGVTADNSTAEADEVDEESLSEGEKENTTEAVDPEDIFEEEQPESVGSGKEKEVSKKEDAVPDKVGDTSPNNFYSSIANALAVDGVFLNSDGEAIKKVDSAESFSELIDAEVNARFDERQKRIDQALNNGVPPESIKYYERVLSTVSNITDAQIAEESERGEELRKQLIFQDFINKGYTQKQAVKYTDRTIDAGTDVEDAREALQSNKEFYQKAYNNLLNEAQKKADYERAERMKENEKLRDSIMKDKNLIGDMEIGNDIRKKAHDNLFKAVYKDPETGEYLTALRKYQLEHKSDFMKYVSLVYTLTNGFKDFDSFTKGKVKKEVKKGLRELEHTLNTTSRSSDGSFRMVSGVKADPESFIGKGFDLDI